MKIDTNLIKQNYDSFKLNNDLNEIKKDDINHSKRTDQLTLQDSKQLEDQKLKVLANEFTSILMKQMFKNMRKTVPEGKLIDGGFAEDVFTDMMDDKISKEGASQASFSSLGQLLYQQLKSK